MKQLLWFILVLGQPLGAIPNLIEEGRQAQEAENYQRAIDLYRQAMDENPSDEAPAEALANLFTDKGLHDLALPVWKEVLRRDPLRLGAWLTLSQTQAFLDENAASVQTLDQARERFPHDPEIIQALAWMLFKTEDFRRGIQLIEGQIQAQGTTRSLEMTLGTLYSAVYDYGLSRVHYLKSVELAPGTSSELRSFRAVAWYNLSLLEKRFYHFDRADEAIRQSLAEEERPAGFLAAGELAQGRRDFVEARRLYEKALEADETPLARFDLAQLYQQFGLLDEAQDQLTEVEHHKDDTWIYNFGVTKDKIRRDFQELQAELHRSRFFFLDFRPRPNPWEWLVWLWDKVREGMLWWYHDQTWKSLLVRLSDSSLAVQNSPDAWISLTLAHRDRPSLALKYLGQIRDHELKQNPGAQASYLVEEGVIRRDRELLEWALKKTQIPWENDDRERAMAALASESQGSGGAEHRRRLTALFQLNPGSLPIRGWGLPVRTSVYGEASLTERWRTAWKDYAGQTGWDASPADRSGATWSVEWRVSAESVEWALRGPEGEFRSGRLPAAPHPLVVISQAFRAIHSPTFTK